MPMRLKDLRLINLESAKDALRDLTTLHINIEARKAAAEKRIQAIKTKLDADNAGDQAELTRLETVLTDYITSNQEQFEKPREIKTDFGSFGLRKATALEVDNEDDAIGYVMDCGYDDCLEIVRRLVKKSVRTRIESGEHIPGCRITTGDLAFWKPNKALVDQRLEETSG